MITDYKKEIKDLISLLVKEDASDLHLSQGRTADNPCCGSPDPSVKKAVLSATDMQGFADQFFVRRQCKDARGQSHCRFLV